jgi:hypothetical protein
VSTEPRKVTVDTVQHGPLTIPEPAWCRGHAGDPVQFFTDLSHRGPEHALTFGDLRIGGFMLAQFPYSARSARHVVGNVWWDIDGISLSPDELDALAAALVEHAAQLRAFARELAVVLAGGAVPGPGVMGGGR